MHVNIITGDALFILEKQNN